MNLDLGRLGVPGVIGLGLLLFCASFFASAILPTREKLISAKREAQRLERVAANAPATVTPTIAPPTIAALLKGLDAAAQKRGFAPTHISYRSSGSDEHPRIEVSQPLRAAYPALRAYLRDALGLAPDASLDELSLQRTLATDATVDTNLKFSFPILP